MTECLWPGGSTFKCDTGESHLLSVIILARLGLAAAFALLHFVVHSLRRVCTNTPRPERLQGAGRKIWGLPPRLCGCIQSRLRAMTRPEEAHSLAYQTQKTAFRNKKGLHPPRLRRVLAGRRGSRRRWHEDDGSADKQNLRCACCLHTSIRALTAIFRHVSAQQRPTPGYKL